MGVGIRIGGNAWRFWGTGIPFIKETLMRALYESSCAVMEILPPAIEWVSN